MILLFLIIYLIGCIFAFIMLIYNESRYGTLTAFDLMTNAVISVSSWCIVICEFPTTIKEIKNAINWDK